MVGTNWESSKNDLTDWEVIENAMLKRHWELKQQEYMDNVGI